MATQFLKEGKATDDDMQSLASLMSMTEQNPPIDLDDDLDENQSNQTAEEISKMLKQFNEFLNNEGNEINENSENKIQSDTVGENLIVNTVENDLDKSISNENIHQKSESENVSATTHDDENLNESLTKGSEIPTSDSQHEEKNPDNAEEFNGSIDSLHDTDKNIVTSETNIKYSDDFTEVNDMDLSLLENIDLETEKFNNLAFPSTTSDLLSWCQSIAKHYSGVEITNMTTSWRNGIAFCAIIHHFRPDLIDFDSLQPSDIVGNCRKAFEAAESIGITKLIDPNQMATLNVPDKLSVMTYLYQLRSYFTDPLFNFQPSKLNSTQSDDQYLNQNQIEYDEKSTIDDSSKSPNNPSRSIGEKTIENESLLLKPMIQKQLTYPFQKNLTLKELDDDQKQETNEKLPKSHTLCDNEFRPEKCSISSPKKFKKICDDLVCNGNKSETTLNENRLQKLQKEARVLWANYQNNQFKTQRNDLNEKRIESLQRRAKKLISDSQKGLLNANSFRDSIDSLRNGHNGLSGVIPNNRSAMRSVEFANRTNDDLKAYRASNNSIKTLEFNFYQFKPTLNTIETNEAKKSPESSKSNDVKTSRNILKKINDVKLSPENLREELINIEDEQKRIDREASILEKRLRKLMESGGDQQLEERLIQNWFVLVNRRNSIIRRQMQLNIREKEADMNQQYEELSNKLRNLMVVEESKKMSWLKVKLNDHYRLWIIK
ncbi:hypothetical protein SSS_08211 [Sarcoptes scabiei]|nr:hypothetical protein SSS_08211 [Sarcoptes scabiei]